MNSKFHGLSSPDDLKQMWKQLKYDSDSKDINVIWDYTSPEQLQPGPNILNILYSPETPQETGHYVLAYFLKSNEISKIIYFNPIASHTLDEISLPKLKLLNDYFKGNVYVDMSGTQPMNGKDSDSCGYYCLTKAFNIYNSLPTSPLVSDNISLSGKLPPEPTTKDYLADILKMLRAIYFRKVFSTPSSNFNFDKKKKTKQKEPKETKEKGEGLSDDMPKTQSENITFKELKHEIEMPEKIPEPIPF